MVTKFLKILFPEKLKKLVKEKLGVPCLAWSLKNLKKKKFYPKVIIDVGAYNGEWTKEVLEIYPAAKTLMIEAQRSKEPVLKKIATSKSNVEYTIALLSENDNDQKIFLVNESGSHVVKHEEPGFDCKILNTTSLDTLLEKMNFPYPDFLKLDVQGHELKVLAGASRSLEHAEVCLLEVALFDIYDNPPLLAEVVSFMDKRNFQAYDISKFMRRPYDLTLFQIDMFFVKKDSALIAEKGWT